MASMVPVEEAATPTTKRRRRPSTVWRDYTINRPADGGAPTATCLACGWTLRAGSNYGTSHLHRHTKSKKCQQLAKDRFTVDGIYIPELYYKLIAEGLDNIEQSSESDKHLSAATNYVPAVAQAASSSTRWFINKTKERKRAENKKRCAPDDESGASMSLHSQTST